MAAAFALLFVETAPALLDEKLFPMLHGGRGGRNSLLKQDQPAMAGCVQETWLVQALARWAKSSASLACHTRAVSVTAR